MTALDTTIDSGCWTATGPVRLLSPAMDEPRGLRGLTLMAPALIVMLAMMVAPVLITIALSFWTQTGFQIDHHADAQELRGSVCARGPSLSGADGEVALGFVHGDRRRRAALAYPMAYCMAFRVTRHKLLWVILITVPFWTSYLLRVFAWKVILGSMGRSIPA